MYVTFDYVVTGDWWGYITWVHARFIGVLMLLFTISSLQCDSNNIFCAFIYWFLIYIHYVHYVPNIADTSPQLPLPFKSWVSSTLHNTKSEKIYKHPYKSRTITLHPKHQPNSSHSTKAQYQKNVCLSSDLNWNTHVTHTFYAQKVVALW